MTSSASGSSTKLDPQKHWNQLLVHKSSPYMQRLADDDDDDDDSSSGSDAPPTKVEGKSPTNAASGLKRPSASRGPKVDDAPKRDILAEIRERAKMYKTAAKAKAEAGRNQMKVNKQSKYINKAAELSDSSSSSSSSSESESEDEQPEKADVIKNTTKTRALKTLGTETKSVNTNSIKSRFEKQDNTMDSSDDGTLMSTSTSGRNNYSSKSRFEKKENHNMDSSDDGMSSTTSGRVRAGATTATPANKQPTPTNKAITSTKPTADVASTSTTQKDMDSSNDGMSSISSGRFKTRATPIKAALTSKPYNASTKSPDEDASTSTSQKEMDSSNDGMSVSSGRVRARTIAATPSIVKSTTTPGSAKEPEADSANTKPSAPPTAAAEEVAPTTTPKPVRMYGKYAMKPVEKETRPIHVRKFKKPLSTSMPPPKEEKPFAVAEKIELKAVSTTTSSKEDEKPVAEKIQLKTVSASASTPHEDEKPVTGKVQLKPVSATSTGPVKEDEKPAVEKQQLKSVSPIPAKAEAKPFATKIQLKSASAGFTIPPAKEEKPVAEKVKLRHVPKKEDSSSATGTSATDCDESSSHDVDEVEAQAGKESVPPPPADKTITGASKETPTEPKSPTAGGWRRASTLKKQESKSESSFDLLDSSSDEEDSTIENKQKRATVGTESSISVAAREKADNSTADAEELAVTADVKNSSSTRDLDTLAKETKTVSTNSIKSKFEAASPKPDGTPKFQIRRPTEIKTISPPPIAKATPNFTLKAVKRPPIVKDNEDASDDEGLIRPTIKKVDETKEVMPTDNPVISVVTPVTDASTETSSKVTDSAADVSTDSLESMNLKQRETTLVASPEDTESGDGKQNHSESGKEETQIETCVQNGIESKSFSASKSFEEDDEPFDMKKSESDDEPFDSNQSVALDESLDTKSPLKVDVTIDISKAVEDDEPFDATTQAQPSNDGQQQDLSLAPEMPKQEQEKELQSQEEMPFDAKDVTTADEHRNEAETTDQNPIDEDEPFDSVKPVQAETHLDLQSQTDDDDEPFDSREPVENTEAIIALDETKSSESEPIVVADEIHSPEIALDETKSSESEPIVVADEIHSPELIHFATEEADSAEPAKNEQSFVANSAADEPKSTEKLDDRYNLKMTKAEFERRTLAKNLVEQSASAAVSLTDETHVESTVAPEAELSTTDESSMLQVQSDSDKTSSEVNSMVSANKLEVKEPDAVVYDIGLNDSNEEPTRIPSSYGQDASKSLVVSGTSAEEQKSAAASSNLGQNHSIVSFASRSNAFNDSGITMDDVEDESDSSSYSDYTESSETGHSGGEGNEPSQEVREGGDSAEAQSEVVPVRDATQNRSSLGTISEGATHCEVLPNKSIGAYLETDKRKKRHRRRRMGGGSNDSTVSVESHTLQMAREFLRKSLSKNNTLKEISIEDLLKELEESEKRQKKLEKQLKQAGVMVAEDIPYEEALEQIERIAKRMKAIGGSDVTHEDKEIQKQLREEYYKLEQEMDKYNNALTMTDEYMKEQEARERKWEEDNEAANLDALMKLRRHMPVNVRHLSEAALTEEPTPNNKYLPKAMAKKFKRTNVLQLLRLNPEDIVRMHPSTLENLRVVGLTLTERRALYVHLKDVGPKWKAMQADKITNRKWVWYQMMKLNFTENLDAYDRHCREYGPPGNHPYATRDNPRGGCPLIGKQCPLKADKIINYDGDYGFTTEAEYEIVGVMKVDVDEQGSKAIQEALELAKEKKANERSDHLKKHYKGKLLLVSKANGSCELMDEAMDKMESNLLKWLEDVTTEAHSTVEEYKKEIQSFTEVLGDLKLAVLQFAEQSGMQVSGKKDANADKKDIRSPVELGLCEEVIETTDEFFQFIEKRMVEIKVHDGKVLSTIIQLRKLLKELHDRNQETLSVNKLTRPPRSRKLKTRKEMEKEIMKNLKPEEEATPAAEPVSTPAGGGSSVPGPPAGGRGDLLAALSGRGGRGGGGGGRGDLLGAIAARGGGRGDLLGAIAARGRGRGGRGGGDAGGGRGDLLAALAGRGGRAPAPGGRGDLMAAIAARGRGRGGGGGRGDLLGAIAARGRGGE